MQNPRIGLWIAFVFAAILLEANAMQAGEAVSGIAFVSLMNLPVVEIESQAGHSPPEAAGPYFSERRLKLVTEIAGD